MTSSVQTGAPYMNAHVPLERALYICARPGTSAHALQCMERLVKAVLGDDAVAPGKVECGQQLEILGIVVAPTAEGFTCSLSAAKAKKSLDAIADALESGSMYSGCAQKLAGRLSWASQFVFKRLGRAMLRPLFAHAHYWRACLSCVMLASSRITA